MLVLTRYGLSEKEVLDLPLDKFDFYLEAANEISRAERQKYVVDTASAVGGLFSKKGISEYLKALDNPEE